MPQVWVQPWEKWVGVEASPDGFSLHLEKSHIRFFVRIHMNTLSAHLPAEFSVPKGDPYPQDVDKEIHHQIELSKKFGIRCDIFTLNGSRLWVKREETQPNQNPIRPSD